jgi:hypothetical protein
MLCGFPQLRHFKKRGRAILDYILLNVFNFTNYTELILFDHKSGVLKDPFFYTVPFILAKLEQM